MAKRRRLTPTLTDPSSEPVRSDLLSMVPPRQRGLAGHGPSLRTAPIAAVAGEAAAAASFAEVSETLIQARREGRLIETLPISAIETTYLVRDRIAVDVEAMDALKASLRSRGQQSPIEVAMLGDGRYGLIAGWRRVTALRDIAAEDGTQPTVMAVLRYPQDAAAAYLAMVEENELRVALTYYERARIAVKAVEQGVYPTQKAALLDLFRSASRAKRSKIRSFITVVEHLDGVLSFPSALGERRGLILARMLQDGEEAALELTGQLLRTPRPAAVAEMEVIDNWQRGKRKQYAAATGLALRRQDAKAEVIQTDTGLTCVFEPDGSVRLQGDAARHPAFRERLLAWLATCDVNG